MILRWFDAREASDFGAALADFLAERLPVGPGGKHQPSQKKRQELFPKIFAQVDRFRCEKKLNIYRKAKLGNAFKWKLLDMGYDADFVDETTKAILTRL